MSWRLVYENNKVCALFESEGTTHTTKNLLFFDTQEECFDKIDELRLNYTYFSGGTTEIIFSGGTRTIEDINNF